MYSTKVAFVWLAAAVLAAPVWGQPPPPPRYLEPGTYNAPAGAEAYTPTVPGVPFYMPGQQLSQQSPLAPQSLLNRDILNADQGIWARLQMEALRSSPPAARQSPEAKAVIHVKAPTAQAELWVNGQPTKQKGLKRVFVTPRLEPGNYRYRFQASWSVHKTRFHEEQTIVFQPGADLLIDFTKNAPPVR